MSFNKFTVRSDIGVDDALALALQDRLRSSENQNLYATFGNCPLEQVNDSSQALLPGLEENWKLNDSIDDVVIMGGDFSGLSSREPNIPMDIEAASLFFKSCDKINVSIVPKNISKLVGRSLDDIRKIPEEVRSILV